MTNRSASNQAIAANAKRLLWAGFLAILAAGIGFGIRGGILASWAADFGFTGAQLGAIGGAGFTGFCFGIIIGGVVVDRIGYGKLVAAAFLFHVLSAFITFAATKGQAQTTAYLFLYLGTFVFALANGTLEAVANPLVSTLFPNNRTHYLNILHASWPAGLVLGGLVGWILGDGMQVGWKLQLGLFLVPTLLYGIAFFGQSFPKSEASAKGLSVWTMLQEVGILGALVACVLIGLFFEGSTRAILSFFTGNAFFTSGTWSLIAWATAGVLLLVVAVKTNFSVGSLLLFVLFVTHALVGAVELGTDGWIQNITGNILTPAQGKILFVFTSLLMFTLRFCVDFIEKHLKLSPIGLLLACAVLGAFGLLVVSRIETFAGAMFALVDLRARQDVLLADDAGRGGRSLPAHRRGRDVDHGRHRHDVGRPDWWAGPGLRQGSLHRRAPHCHRPGRLRAGTRRRRRADSSSSPRPPASTAPSCRRRRRRSPRRRSSRWWRTPASSATARRWWRTPSFRWSWRSSTCCCCSTSRRWAGTSR